MFESELWIRKVGPRVWALTSPLTWTGSQGDTFTVPVGFVTDFATVPRVLRSAVEPYGAYTEAAVLHDWLLAQLAHWWDEYTMGGPHGFGNADMALASNLPAADSRDADEIFRLAMYELGVPWAKRWAMWAAVRCASLFSRKRSYGRALSQDVPKLLGMLPIAVLILSPSVIGNAWTLAMARVVTTVTGKPPYRRRGRPAGDQRKGHDHA